MSALAGRRRTGERRDLRRARVRITAVTVLGLLAVLVVTGLVLVRLHERELEADMDRELEAIAAGSERFSEVNLPASVSTSIELPLQVVDDDGGVLFASPPLRGEPALWQPGDTLRPHTVRTAASGTHRVVATRFRGSWLVLAGPLQPVDESVSTLRYGLLVTGVPLAAVVGLVIWFAVGHALRPVGAAAEREERLVADVSHELRSPLAGMRVLLETEGGDGDEIARTRADALATLARMEALTDQLLVLTRHERSPVTDAQPVDLDQSIHERVAEVATRTDVAIDTDGVRAGQVVGEPDALEGMIDNLLANAVRHARQQVRVALDEGDGTVTLTVDDDGPGVPAAERERMFERFTRLDEARARAEGGSGLGLAIVRAAVDAHGGEVAIGDAPLGGARLVVRLPASTT
ncbi:MAG TPA: ATP-binding protein [Iamia sp.]|nr:ATP-binding protein [Iamia sp.]